MGPPPRPATHLHGNDGLEDLHWLPKEGVVDWERVARAFPGSTYTGTIALEVVPRDDSVPPVAFLQQAYAQVQWLEQLFAQASE